jgi:hypothetical protein
MAAEDQIGSFFDVPEIRRDAELVKKEIKDILDFINKVNTTRVSLQAADKSKDVVSGINDLNQQVTGLAAKIKDADAQQAKLVETTKKAAAAMADESKAAKDLSGAYGELVKQLVKNQVASKDLAAQRKTLADAFKAGRLSEQQYVDSLSKIKEQELQISQSNQELNRAIRNIAKESNAAAGSLDQLRAKLNLAMQAYDRLSADEKQSNIGTELRKQIQGLTKDISAQEQLTGRFQRNVGNYASAFKGAGLQLASGLAAITGVTFGLVGLKDFFSGAIDEFNQAEQAASRLHNVLSNMGKDDVFGRLDNEAKRLASTFKNLDNDDILGVFQQLVTYGKLTEDQIKELTPVIIDFAAKQKISLADSASVIIKALEGNGKALKEYGIDMKDAKSTTEAFGLIMTELKPKVEGAAKAFGKTTAGQLAITSQQINDLKEDIGSNLQPVLKNFYSFLQKTLEFLPRLFNSTLFNTNKLVGALKLLPSALANLPTEGFASFGRLLGNEVDGSNKAQLTLPEDTVRPGKGGTLGGGKADKAFNSDAAKAAAKKRAEAEQKALLELLKFRKEQEADYEKEISGIEFLSAERRIEARKKQAEAEKDVLDIQARIELSREGVTGDEIKKIHEKLADDRIKKEAELSIAIIAIRKNAADVEKQIEKDATAAFDKEEAQRAQARKDAAKAELDAVQARNSGRETNLNFGKDVDLIALEEKRKSGLISEEDYQKQREKIESDYDILILKSRLDMLEEILAITKANGGDVVDAEEKIAALRLKIEQETNDKTKKSREEQKADIIKSIEDIKEVYTQIASVIGDAFNIDITKQKNDIQDQMDALDAKTKAEIDGINASADAEERKAAKITMVQARAAAQKEQLQKRQRQLDQQKAQFDKANAIFEIVINTAAAIAKDLGNPVKVAIDAALGAAQLAVAIATPIPKYKHGTEDHAGGFAVVGDGGKKELVELPSGDMYVTSNKPELMYLPQHSKVLPDAEAVMNDLHGMSYKRLRNAPDVQVKQDFRPLEKKLDKVIGAIERNPTIKNIITHQGIRRLYDTGQREITWINRNMQS